MATSTSKSSSAIVILAPDRSTPFKGKSVFLAGSIDMGSATNWQKEAIDRLGHLPITITSPRRPDWDSTWKQEYDFQPFREQVDWELDMLDKVDVIMLWFAGGSVSPISLLELGLYANSKRIVVGCPKDYHRRGNVEIVCRRTGVPMFENFEGLLKETERLLSQ